MEPLGPEDSNEKKGASLLRWSFGIAAGVLVGAIIGASAVALFFRNAVQFDLPSVQEFTVNPQGISPNVDVASTTDSETAETFGLNRGGDTTTTRSEPITVPLPSDVVSEDYFVTFNRILNNIQTVSDSNNAVLVPQLNSLKDLSAAGNFDGIFDIVVEVKTEIRADRELLEDINRDIDVLSTENSQTTESSLVRENTESFLQAVDVLTNSFSDYFDALDAMLTGRPPTQEQLNTLNTTIESLQSDRNLFQTRFTTLLQNIQDTSSQI